MLKFGSCERVVLLESATDIRTERLQKRKGESVRKDDDVAMLKKRQDEYEKFTSLVPKYYNDLGKVFKVIDSLH